LGSSIVHTNLSDNASELRRIRKCIDDVASRTEYALDSLLIVASCSPEGTWALNRRLSARRAEAVRDYLMDYVPEEWKDSLKTSEIPENWSQLDKLVRNDSTFSEDDRRRLLRIIEERKDPDAAERRLASLPQYRYLREKIYPKLRSVSFDFHLHRIGMVKDTIHTMELDSAYLAGVEALKELDYKKAVTLLRPYGDYNSALAYMSADYNHSALDVLKNLDDTDSRVCYLKAVVLSRLGVKEEALKYFRLGVAYDPSLEHRANLDPELFEIIKLNNLKSKVYEKN
jgi:tetratricopeptide (TPR) repeat protein